MHQAEVKAAEAAAWLTTYRAAEAAIQFRCSGTGDAVAAIDGDFHGAAQLDVTEYARQIRRQNIYASGSARRACVRGACSDFIAQSQDGLTVQGAATHHHLKTVVIGGIMAAGHRDARPSF